MNMASCLNLQGLCDSAYKVSSARLKNKDNTSDLTSVRQIASKYNLETGVG